MMVSGFYFIVFLLSLAMMANFFYRNKRIDPLYILFVSSVTVNNLGCWLVSISTVTEQAIWANKVIYTGSCFAPLLLACVLARVCSLKIPKWILGFQTALAAVTLGFVMTIGQNGLYYKSIELSREGGFGHLIKEYGPAHNLYFILIGTSMILILYELVYCFRHRQQLPSRTVGVFCGLCIGIVITYAVSRILKSSIEWTSVGYLIAVLIAERRFEHMNIYDIASNIAISVEKTGEYGFIVFDNKQHYINSNELVKNYFPELRDLHTEKPVEKSDSVFYKEVMERYLKWYNLSSEDKKWTVHLGDQYLDFSIRDINYGKRKAGDLIEVIDRTTEHKYTAKMEQYSIDLSEEVRRQTAHINEIKNKMVIGMAAMIESRDNSTGGHIRRTSDVVALFAEKLLEDDSELSLDRDFLDYVIKAAPMHDLGKIAVDDAILRKQGKFTDDEYNEMKKHSAEGAKTVRSILQGIEDEKFVRIAENIAHYHHEKWNGTGYPCRLAGEEIPIEARIMALADVFDALVSKRCYKEAFTYDKAFEIIENDLGTHFDPVLGRLFLNCCAELMAMYDDINA